MDTIAHVHLNPLASPAPALTPNIVAAPALVVIDSTGPFPGIIPVITTPAATPAPTPGIIDLLILL